MRSPVLANAPISYPRKPQKTKGFQVFSGDIKWEHGQKWVNFQVINKLQVTAHAPNHHQHHGIIIIFLTNVQKLIFFLRKNRIKADCFPQQQRAVDTKRCV